MFKMADDSMVNSTPSLSQFIVQQVRQRNLLGNERTTLLSHREELQIIQYCMARHNKEANGVFHADPKQSCRLLTAVKEYKKRLLEKIIESKLNRENENSYAKSMEQKGNSDHQPDDSLSVKNENSRKEEENLNSKSPGSQCTDVTINFESLGECTMAKFVAQELNLEDSLVDTILKLFHENLKFSNHITMMDVYERFVNEFLKEESNITENMSSVIFGTGICKDKETSGIESLISNLLNKTDYSPSLNTQRTESETVEPNCHDDYCVESTPKTPRTSKTLSCANERTPSGGSTSFASTPTSSILRSTPLAGERQEVQKKFIENVFQCYLHLLVNSRCEVALATIFNIPERELSHDAFTHLKHLATTSKLSMFQTLSTFLMRIRLGGQGYAPSTDEPLLGYIKGLGTLFDLIDKMQTVIEENPQPRSVCRRLINIIKCNLSGCRSGKFPRSVVEIVAENIFSSLSTVLERHRILCEEEDTEKPVNSGGSLNGQKSLFVIRDYLDISATASSPIDHYMLFDLRFSENTPTRFPSLFSKFKSPMPMTEESPEEENQEESKEDLSLKQNTHRPQFKASEALFLDGSNDDDIICTPFETAVMPSKTIVHPGCLSKDFILHQNAMATGGKLTMQPNGNCLKTKAGKKREKKNVLPVDDKENSICPEKLPRAQKPSPGDKVKSQKIKDNGKDNAKMKGKSCRRKLMVQVKGQSKITGFFKT